jgi:hypothetical protein
VGSDRYRCEVSSNAGGGGTKQVTCNYGCYENNTSDQA